MTPRKPFAPQLDLEFEEPRHARHIWAVRDLVAQVRELVEENYGDIWVEGEISNFRPAPSGHVYFTLKDADAQLPIVLFRRQAMLLRFRPEDGLHVLVRGHVSVYEQRGQIQLVAETMEPIGAGSLQLAFEQLKERLKAEGLFEAERKKPSARISSTVGIVTSPTGAVIRDFLNIVGRRHSGLNVLLFPVSVQGESASRRNRIRARSAQRFRPRRCYRPRARRRFSRGPGRIQQRTRRSRHCRVAPARRLRRRPRDRLHHRRFRRRPARPYPSAAAELITEAQHQDRRTPRQLRRIAWTAQPASSCCRSANGSPRFPPAAQSRASLPCSIA